MFGNLIPKITQECQYRQEDPLKEFKVQLEAVVGQTLRQELGYKIELKGEQNGNNARQISSDTPQNY